MSGVRIMATAVEAAATVPGAAGIEEGAADTVAEADAVLVEAVVDVAGTTLVSGATDAGRRPPREVGSSLTAAETVTVAGSVSESEYSSRACAGVATSDGARLAANTAQATASALARPERRLTLACDLLDGIWTDNGSTSWARRAGRTP